MQSFLQPPVYFIKQLISIFLILKIESVKSILCQNIMFSLKDLGFRSKPSTGSLKSEATFQPGFLNHGGSPS